MNQTAENIVKIDTKPKYIPIEDIVKLIEVNGHSQTEAAKILNCTKQAISARCKKHGITPNGVKAYIANKADMIAFKGRMVLNSLTPSDLHKASGYQKVGMYALLNTHYRLETDQSTHNLANIHADIEAIRGQIKGKAE